jgi:hypothetical protein
LWHGCEGIFNTETQRTQRFTEEIALLSKAQVPGDETTKEKKRSYHMNVCYSFFSLVISSPGICVRKRAIFFRPQSISPPL